MSAAKKSAIAKAAVSAITPLTDWTKKVTCACGVQFSSATNFMTHLKRVHSITPGHNAISRSAFHHQYCEEKANERRRLKISTNGDDEFGNQEADYVQGIVGDDIEHVVACIPDHHHQY
jgi:hypothetical protein